jgi:hypothetical protein
MPEQEGVKLIMGKLYAKASLTQDELSTLQRYVDQLENEAVALDTSHYTSSSPGSHYTSHSTTIKEVAGLLDRVKRS